MPETEKQETARKSGIAYAAALAIVAAVVTFSGLGWLADRWFGTSPWLMAGGLVLGAIGGLYEFIRLSSKLS